MINFERRNTTTIPLPPMATSVVSISKQTEEELMISRDDIQFTPEIITSLKMILQEVEALDITSLDFTSLRTMSQVVENLNAKIKTFCKEKSTTPEVLMPPVDKASHIPQAQGVETFNAKIETLCSQKSTTPKPALTEGFSVAEAAAANGFDMGKVLTYKDLQHLTNNFSSDNCMGRTQFGELYKGFIPEDWKERMRSGEVTIKMWKNERLIADRITPARPEGVRYSMEQEIKFLQQPDIALHPYTVNVMGYCFEEDKLGVVYDLKPLQTLQKYIDNDNFGWLKRVSVAVKLAYLLKFFHENEPQYIVRNLSPAHVMLDQDLNPVLIDYAMINGGSFVDLWPPEVIAPRGSHGYVYVEELMVGLPTERNDMYAYGVILLEILRRCTYRSEEVTKGGRWSRITYYAWDHYHRHKAVKAKLGFIWSTLKKEKFIYSFAHKCLRDDDDYDALDGNKISLLALKCVESYQIPTIDEVMKELKKLKVVRSHPELLSLLSLSG